jgi:hypothetical protein
MAQVDPARHSGRRASSEEIIAWSTSVSRKRTTCSHVRRARSRVIARKTSSSSRRAVRLWRPSAGPPPVSASADGLVRPAQRLVRLAQRLDRLALVREEGPSGRRPPSDSPRRAALSPAARTGSAPSAGSSPYRWRGVFTRTSAPHRASPHSASRSPPGPLVRAWSSHSPAAPGQRFSSLVFLSRPFCLSFLRDSSSPSSGVNARRGQSM